MGARRKDTGIWKAPNGMWGIDYRTPDGKRHRPIIGLKQRAKDVLHQRKVEILDGRYRPQPQVRMTFAELVEKSLESKRGLISEFSYYSDRQRLTEISKTLGPHLIDQITPIMCDDLLTKLRLGGLEGSTCNRYRMAMSGAFAYAVRMKLLVANPLKGIPQYKEADERRRCLDADEDAALFAAIRRLHPEREAEAVLMLNTGLRKGGHFALRWQDVNLESRQIVVHSKRTRYEVSLNDQAVAALRELHARSGGREKVCQSGCYSRSMDWLNECVKAAGIEDFTAHDLRHTFGTRAIKAGADLCSVQKLMGHKSILTTRKRYVHLDDEHLLAQVQKLGSAQNDKPLSTEHRLAQVAKLLEDQQLSTADKLAQIQKLMDSRKDKSKVEAAQVVELKAVSK